MATTQALAPRQAVLEAITKAKSEFEGRLPKDMTVQRFTFGIRTAVQKNANLVLCTPYSVILAAYEAAEVGCDLSPSRQLGWLIPYGKVAQFQPSYRFFIQEAYRAGCKAFYAEVVYAADKFDRQFAPKRNLFHVPADDVEKRLRPFAIGAYALVELPSGNIDWEYLTLEQIERHRAKSKQQNSMKWTEFWEEGFRITAIRVLFKRLPLFTPDMERLAQTINRDEERDLDLVPPGTVELEPDSPLQSVQGTAEAAEAFPGHLEHAPPAKEPPQEAAKAPITRDQELSVYDRQPESTAIAKAMRAVGHSGKLPTLPAEKWDEFITELERVTRK